MEKINNNKRDDIYYFFRHLIVEFKNLVIFL